MKDILTESRKVMIIELLEDKHYKPLKFKELCMMLNVPKDERKELKMLLD